MATTKNKSSKFPVTWESDFFPSRMILTSGYLPCPFQLAMQVVCRDFRVSGAALLEMTMVNIPSKLQ